MTQGRKAIGMASDKTGNSLFVYSNVTLPISHGCCWETFYMFAYCGLVVEIQIHFAKI